MYLKLSAIRDDAHANLGSELKLNLADGWDLLSS
jgi:hypothetical protein